MTEHIELTILLYARHIFTLIIPGIMHAVIATNQYDVWKKTAGRWTSGICLKKMIIK